MSSHHRGSSHHDDSSDVDSSESGQSGSSTTETNHTGKGSNTSDEVLAKQETRAVNRSKLLVLGVITAAAAACGAATYFFTSNKETDDFQTQFTDYAVEVVDVTHHEARNVLVAVESFANSITSFVLEANMTFPNVTVPHFELRGQTNNELSRAVQLSLVPLVTSGNKNAWNEYSVQNQGWIRDGLQQRGLTDVTPDPIHPEIFIYEEKSGTRLPQNGPGVDFGPGNYAPVWQQAPAPQEPHIINYDLLTHPILGRVYHGMWETGMPVLSEAADFTFLYGGAVVNEDGHDKNNKDNVTHPHSALLHPIYPTFLKNRQELHDRDDLVAFVVAVLSWDRYFNQLLPEGVNGIVVVLHDSCGDHHTYQINGPDAVYLGKGDLHDPRYDHLLVSTEFASFLSHNYSDTYRHCEYDVLIYPSAELESQYTSNKPAVYTAVVVLVFFFTAMVFVLYDYLVQRRQEKVMATATRTNAIVSSLFPSNVRDRILKDAEAQAEAEMKDKKAFTFGAAPKAQLKTFLDEENEEGGKVFESKPIADLFPSTTVMFADIVGFTAWSSVREPSQVFTLLETLYHAFDEIAKRRRVFKVETVGDCYVAVCGLPDPRKDHAVVMCRFSRDCQQKMNDMTKKLEVSLGPDTGDLSMRFGLHSGPVTAGVLRGDKSRFQLFGDTVNTASRIESTGERNRIHLSAETANLLMNSGKSHWVSERQDRVQAKGKGEIQTYWLELKQSSGASATSKSSSDDCTSSHDFNLDDTRWVEAGLKPIQINKAHFDEKTQRLVDWNCDVLARLLRQIISRRNASGNDGGDGDNNDDVDDGELSDASSPSEHGSGGAGGGGGGRSTGQTVIDEVREIIHLPEYDPGTAKNQEDPDSVVLDKEVTTQLRDYIAIIASMYRANPFHNFEHASHVTMSVVKLQSRIVAPDSATIALPPMEDTDGDGDGEGGSNAHADATDKIALQLHDHTFGITSDPLTQFACVFSALIHDVDHTGVPNATLIKEESPIAIAYKNQSVAEQNSIDVSWDLLMDTQFSALRGAIYNNSDADKRRFRQLVVNSVMATDIVDKELKALRNARWDTAFQESPADAMSIRDNINRKATIVIEHLIQASDIAHTMQHWHIYRKWNERLFLEMLNAFRAGRADKDPAEFWYKGEIGFFDFYIIPLAKKLKDCGVFGVSSDEYLNYAEKNRQEWELRGQDVVANMIEKYKLQEGGDDGEGAGGNNNNNNKDVRLDEVQLTENVPTREELLRSNTVSSTTDDDDETDAEAA